MSTLGVIFWAFALFVCPGYALLVMFGVHRRYAFGEMLVAALGVSIGVVPMILYISTELGVVLNSYSVSLIVLLLGSAFLLDIARRIRASYERGLWRLPQRYLFLGILSLATLVARLWMVRGIEYPLWTDSYHHTVITELIVETGGIPECYRPYAPVDTFTYHFGFHALAATFHWLTRIPIPRAVVLVGQIVNAIVVPTAYLLASRLFKRPDVGVVTAAIVGLVSHMPALFVNWGRYTQLSGQAMVPVLMVFWLDLLSPTSVDRRRLSALLGTTAASLFLVHIRVFLFYSIFCGVSFLVSLGRVPRRGLRMWLWSFFRKGFWVSLIGGLILLPWAARFMAGFGSRVLDEMVEGYQQVDTTYFAWHWDFLWLYGMRIDLWVVAGAGLLWAFVRRESCVLILVLWSLAMMAAANVQLAGLYPLFSNLVVSKFLYLPGAIMAAYGAVETARLMADNSWIPFELQWFGKFGAVFLTGLICVVGMPYTSALIEPDNGFVREGDLRAMRWIDETMDPDAVFYVATRFWTPLIAHGLDAGYWLPLLAHRETILPVQMYGSDGTQEVINMVVERALALKSAPTTEALWSVMRSYGVTHVYIGERPTYLQPETFLSEPGRFTPIYSDGSVWIFQAE